MEFENKNKKLGGKKDYDNIVNNFMAIRSEVTNQEKRLFIAQIEQLGTKYEKQIKVLKKEIKK